MEIDLIKSDLTPHLVILCLWVVDVDLRDTIDNVECFFAGSFSLSQSLNVGSYTSKSDHSEKHSKKD